MPKPILSFSPTKSQELYRVIINATPNTETIFESECLSECIHEAWELVHRGYPAARVDILALNPVNLWCSIWGDEFDSTG